MNSILDYLEIEEEEKKRLKASELIRDEKLFIDAVAYGILAPTIIDSRWPKVNQDLILKAKAIRMIEAPKCLKEEMATEFDALVYIHTVSLCIPLSKHWFRIYCYLFRKYFPRHAEKLQIKIEELSYYEMYELNKLRKWIFMQQIKALKNRR